MTAVSEAPFDLEASWRGDVLEVDAPEDGSIRCTVSTSSSADEARRHTGHGVHPGKVLEQDGLAFHHRQRRVRAMSPRPSTAVPSVTTPTVLAFMV